MPKRSALAVIALLLFLAACGGSAKPTTKATPTLLLLDPVVAQIKPKIEAQTGKPVQSITCPELPLPFAVGTSFHCQVAFIDGSTLALYVSQADDRGTVHWTESASSPASTLLSDSVVGQLGPALLASGIDVDSVECPDGMPVRSGYTFDCTLTYDGGKTTPIRITETDEQGTFTWATTVILADVVVAQVKPEVEAQTGKSVESMACPDALPLAAGTSFDCQVTFVDGSTMAIPVSQTDDQGHLAWDLSP